MATGANAAPPVAQWFQGVKKARNRITFVILFSNQQFIEFSFPVFECIISFISKICQTVVGIAGIRLWL